MYKIFQKFTKTFMNRVNNSYLVSDMSYLAREFDGSSEKTKPILFYHGERGERRGKGVWFIENQRNTSLWSLRTRRLMKKQSQFVGGYVDVSACIESDYGNEDIFGG